MAGLSPESYVARTAHTEAAQKKVLAEKAKADIEEKRLNAILASTTLKPAERTRAANALKKAKEDYTNARVEFNKAVNDEEKLIEAEKARAEKSAMSTIILYARTLPGIRVDLLRVEVNNGYNYTIPGANGSTQEQFPVGFINEVLNARAEAFNDILRQNIATAGNDIGSVDQAYADLEAAIASGIYPAEKKGSIVPELQELMYNAILTEIKKLLKGTAKDKFNKARQLFHIRRGKYNSSHEPEFEDLIAAEEDRLGKEAIRDMEIMVMQYTENNTTSTPASPVDRFRAALKLISSANIQVDRQNELNNLVESRRAVALESSVQRVKTEVAGGKKVGKAIADESARQAPGDTLFADELKNNAEIAELLVNEKTEKASTESEHRKGNAGVFIDKVAAAMLDGSTAAITLKNPKTGKDITTPINVANLTDAMAKVAAEEAAGNLPKDGTDKVTKELIVEAIKAEFTRRVKDQMSQATVPSRPYGTLQTAMLRIQDLVTADKLPATEQANMIIIVTNEHQEVVGKYVNAAVPGLDRTQWEAACANGSARTFAEAELLKSAEADNNANYVAFKKEFEDMIADHTFQDNVNASGLSPEDYIIARVRQTQKLNWMEDIVLLNPATGEGKLVAYVFARHEAELDLEGLRLLGQDEFTTTGEVINEILGNGSLGLDLLGAIKSPPLSPSQERLVRLQLQRMTISAESTDKQLKLLENLAYIEKIRGKIDVAFGGGAALVTLMAILIATGAVAAVGLPAMAIALSGGAVVLGPGGVRGYERALKGRRKIEDVENKLAMSQLDREEAVVELLELAEGIALQTVDPDPEKIVQLFNKAQGGVEGVRNKIRKVDFEEVKKKAA